MEEVFEHTRRLLEDKCVVTIRELINDLHRSDKVFLVTGTRNKELVG